MGGAPGSAVSGCSSMFSVSGKRILSQVAESTTCCQFDICRQRHNTPSINTGTRRTGICVRVHLDAWLARCPVALPPSIAQAIRLLCEGCTLPRLDPDEATESLPATTEPEAVPHAQLTELVEQVAPSESPWAGTHPARGLLGLARRHPGDGIPRPSVGEARRGDVHHVRSMGLGSD